MSADLPRGPLQIDVGQLVQRTVASLYSSLVTRPTGRAVRLAIESQLAEEERRPDEAAFSLIDLSEVTVLDFSCADEVVAKLLLRYLEDDRPRDAFFVFRGVTEVHRDPIEAVLERQELAAVAQHHDGRYDLLGTRTEPEWRVWRVVEERGRMPPPELTRALVREEEREALERLVTRRLVFRAPRSGDVHALSRLVADLTSR